MDWSRFNLHGDAPERAFESLTGTLFERWCRREYADQIRRVVFVNGAGGDGGVEAYTQLKDGQVIGLQAKWFREPLKSSQIEQIRKSLKTASDNRSGLSRYIVTIPRDLSDPKTTKQQAKTERDRWDDFIKESNQQYPDIIIDLWGEAQITQLLAELGSEGLRSYWFEGSVVDVNYLNLQFKRAKSGWLTPRYSPDLHQSGQIESDLQLRLNEPTYRPKWLSEVSHIRILLEQAHRAVLRLRWYPEFMQRDDADALITATEAWLISAIAQQQELEKRLKPGNSFPLPNLEDEVIDLADTRQLIKVLLNDNVSLHWGSSASTTSDISKQLKDTLERWEMREVTPQKLQELGQPAAYIGEPGVGKTHALADAVRQHLEKGKPAILLRAKDNIDLSKSWDTVLANAVGESGWNLRQVLDALETAAIQAEVQATVNITDDSEFKPVRVLVAIDGLDETFRAEHWAEKLGELLPLAQQYPRILFVCSLRTSLYRRLSIPKDISQVGLRGSDAPLEDIFASYCKVNRIECPQIVRWALQNPLAIRLFADLYRGQHIDSVTLQEFSLVTLIRKKIDHTERAIRENDPEGWTDKITPVHNTLRGIVKACLDEGKALSQAKALQVAEAAQKTPGILSKPQFLSILDNCLNHGLLLLTSQPSDDPLEPDLLLWEPAYETLTDFLLALEAYNSAKNDPATPTMPTYLKYRANAIVLTAYLLGKEDYDFFATGLWRNDLSEQEREELRLRTILMMPPQQGLAYQDWVVELFQRNMPSCRKVLERLVIPGLRIPGYFYGAKFIHDTLLPMQVAKRDLFWSGSDYLPANHGAPWEGFGTPVLDQLEIADDDPWDAAALLLAWATTTVKNDLRRRIREQLAVWGSNKPNELLNLLKCACQTNDPQMREDILSAAYGASCLARPDGEWLQLCNWIIDNFFVPNAPLYTHNVIVRHSAKSMIERCVICEVPVDEDRLVYVRHPHVDPEELLPIDRQAAINADEHLGIEPATLDLARYVVLERAIEPFFDEIILANAYQNDSKEYEEEETDQLEEIDRKILDKFLEGSLRKFAEPQARQLVENFLIRKAIAQGIRTAFDSATDEEQSEVLQHWGSTDEEAEEEETVDIQDETQSQSEYSPSAQTLLSRYIAKYNLQGLTPIKLAFGCVVAYTNQLGWSEDIFIKTPNGDKPGEIIGADISIERQHEPANRDSRSSIASFAEKYVWAATNELTGFFAARLEAYTGEKYLKPPIDIGLFTEITNPASDVGFRQSNINQFLDFSELIPDTDLSKNTQVDRANEWVKKAPIPDVQPLLLPNSEQLPEWARNYEWVVLRSVATERHTDSQAESVLRISGFLFPSSRLPLLEEDVQLKVLPRLYEFCSDIFSVQTYCDPCEVAWASWIQEREGLIDYSTLDIAGKPVKFDIQAATCQFSWEAASGETKECMPAKRLREALGIVDFKAGQFLSASGEVIAFTLNRSGERWQSPRDTVLLARRDAILEMLEQEKLSMGWGVWIYREPAYPLNGASRERMFRDWRAVAFWQDDGLKMVTYQDVIEPWNKD
ncbi:MAG: hypothetical protein RID09_03255 [Coleofasciculus sp. G1-WW12-02]|uniref:hypothetical protein n=1 Tax=Coleofasciculus sp. G1-WW12-02 TaxID=3068483 RepID=UPI0032FAE044